MTSRRGIFFNSKSRPIDKIINPLPPEISNTDPSSSNIQITTTTTTPPPTTVKKKIVLNHTKRPLTKTNYSGPRKIFSTNYKVIHFLMN
jgi:hypothetical protein